MAGADSQKLQDKLQEMAKQLASGRGNRADTAAVLAEAVERLNALEVSNKRLREEMRGPAQIAWSKFMSDAIQGYLSHEVIALEFTESQWQSVLDNCEDIAEAALIRWKLRWVDGVSPVRRARRGRVDVVGAPPGAPSLASAGAETHDLEHLFESAPRQGGPRMVAAEVPPKPATAPAPEERPPAPSPPPVASAPAPSSKPTQPPMPPPSLPSPKKRQPGDD